MIEEAKTAEEIALAQVTYEMREKIKLLCNFDGDSLQGEMVDLKKSLLENPAACSLLLPEEIGELVTTIRRMTGVAIAEANAPKERTPRAKKSTTKLTAAELQAQLALIPDDDL
jgi:hypothetical protein